MIRERGMTSLSAVRANKWGSDPSLLGRIMEGSPEAMLAKLRSEVGLGVSLERGGRVRG